ncbi:MAG: Kelch domain protein, partial [Verrucomicrobiales bacterium]|nr:Kelch domain protein [Verrucomicrobiales bacterium]
DPVANRWAATPWMGGSHPGGTATTLPNGKVLVCGGGTAETFDPATGFWRGTSPMNVNHTAQTATLLPNGKVLVTGGGSAEINDSSANTWMPTSPMNSTNAGTATLLPNGTVLVVAGTVTEAYDPSSDVWTKLTGEPHPRTFVRAILPRAAHTATLLPDGRVLIEGSLQFGDPIELYDPATDTWTTSDREIPMRYCGTAHLLPSGAVLFIGGGTFQLENDPCSIYVPFFDAVPPFRIWGAVPNGLTMVGDPANGIADTLSGMPQAVGTTIVPVTATDWYGKQLCLTFKLVVLPSRSPSDTTAPTVTITKPTSSGATVSNQFITITGTAADQGASVNTGVALVLYSLNGGPQQIASTTSHFANWSAGVVLNTGANTFTVQSFDYRGNASTPVTYTINYQWYSPLTVLTHGLGTVSIRSGTQLAGDHTYSIKATPGKQQMFSNWVENANGLPLTSSTQCAFVMKSNLTLVANFVPNPIAVNKLNGSYNGLFSETSGVAEKSAGAIFNLAVKTNHTYSGKLYLAGGVFVLAGTFDVAGNDSQTIARAGAAVNASLHMDWNTGSKQITGTVSCVSENWTAPLVADLAVFGPGYPYSAHRCTMALAPAPDAPTNSPSGYGYGLMNIPANRVLHLSGKLADGTPFSQTVPLSKDGNAPIYCDLYNHRGLIAGWLSFASDHPVGSLTWVAPANVVPGYSVGFNRIIDVIGSIYTPHSPALNLPTATLNIAGGFGGESPLQFKVIIDNNNTITKDTSSKASGFNSTNSVSGNIQTSTGLITLKYLPTGASQNRNVFGVALPNTDCAYGAFATPSGSGSVTVH